MWRSFLCPKGGRMKDKPRIGTAFSDRIEVCNANYLSSGERLAHFERPWTVFTPRTTRTFATHAEAIQYAHQEAGKA